MNGYLQILALIVTGTVLLWFGYSMFFGRLSPWYPGWWPWKRMEKYKGKPGDPQICPLCSVRLIKGELVKSLAFPSVTGGIDRLMYIRGCYSCLHNNLPRKCPICGASLSVNDYLVSRMFERRTRRNHVHVLGCNHCKKTGSLAR